MATSSSWRKRPLGEQHVGDVVALVIDVHEDVSPRISSKRDDEEGREIEKGEAGRGRERGEEERRGVPFMPQHTCT